uniref:Exportin-7/Ran-binding protein 17 TPR repeats domain-containing protein n=1 Tax=Acrobeloides nanus TaxID=290746 RepID=A0A914EG71_9BILA
MADINILNEICRQLFEATDPTIRRRAEEAFNELIESPDCLEKCLLLFEQGIIPYSPMTACNVLLKVVSRKVGLSNEQRSQLLQYLLKYVLDRFGSLPNFAINSICQLYGRLTKISWLDGVDDSFPFQEPVEKIMELLKEENERSIIGMKLLMAFIDDMLLMTGLEGVGKQRRIAISFRDRYLCDIYMLTIDQLRVNASKEFNDLRIMYIESCLSLALSCMSFDFVGSFIDETIDENYNIQLPANWRSRLIERNPVKLFFELYDKVPIKTVALILRNLILLSAIRRTLFDAVDRKKFLTELLVGIRMVLQYPRKLEESDNFHEFCRLISRIKSNFQLLELVNIREFTEVVSLITDFTLKGFEVAEAFGQNSVYYLMNFWNRMASAVRTSSADKTEMIITSFPKVTTAFIQSRMSICYAVVREGIDDPLDESHSIKQVMEYFSLICRIQYAETFQQLTKEFVSNMQMISTPGVGAEDVRVAQKRLIWLVSMIGAAIEGKTASMYVSEHELMDGELASRVLELMKFNDANLTHGIQDSDAVHLELAFIFFLDHMRKMYLSEAKDGKIFEKFKELIGINNGSQLLAVFARKIITNLKFWCGNEEICHGSLKLLNDLTVGLIASRRLLAIDDMQLLLRNHTSQHFVFLAPTPNLKLMKARTVFYEALMRLMAIELDDDLSKFHEFLAPLTNNFNEISGAFDNLLAVNPDQLKLAVIGLAHDITGLAMSCTKNSIFALLLNWLMPDVFGLLLRSIELWYSSVEVTKPILKLMSELAQNRQSRMAFEMKSCTSVVLFREISKILCAYGERFLALPQVPENSNDLYKLRLKNYGICFGVLRNVLSGSYLPFGVFWLYGDNCLKNALDVIFRMFMVLKNEHPQFMHYPKISQNILYLLQAVMKDNISYVSKIDPNILRSILYTCHDGIISLDCSTVTASSAIVESLLDYLYLRISRSQNVPPPPFHEPEGEVIYQVLYVEESKSQLMCQFIDTIMNMVLFGDVISNYSIGRVLMGLLFIYYEYFGLWKQQFIARQSAEMHKALDEAFNSLTAGVKNSISSRNKDDFTMNLNSFKSEVAQILRGIKQDENEPDMEGNSFGSQNMFVYNYA